MKNSKRICVKNGLEEKSYDQNKWKLNQTKEEMKASHFQMIYKLMST